MAKNATRRRVRRGTEKPRERDLQVAIGQERGSGEGETVQRESGDDCSRGTGTRRQTASSDGRDARPRNATTGCWKVGMHKSRLTCYSFKRNVSRAANHLNNIGRQ